MHRTPPRKKSIRLALSLMMLAATIAPLGCDTDDEPSSPEVDALDPAEIDVVRIPDGEGFILESAQQAPDERVRVRGPVTLRYVGPHRYVAPDGELVVDEFVDEDEADGDGLDAHMGNVRIVDEHGHEWQVEQLEIEEIEALAEDYRASLDSIRESATTDGHTNWGDVDDLLGPITPQLASAWTEFSCTFGTSTSTKWRFNNGTHSDLDGMNNSQRRPILDTDGTGFSGTAVLIAPNLALTAGHVASALAPGDSMCRRFGTSGTQCRNVNGLAISGDGGGNDDWGLVRFSADFTGGLVYNLSDEKDGKINDFTPRIAAYPTLRMAEESTCGTSSLLEGERNTGTFHALLKKDARLNITAGGGSSGAPYYYYSGGDYWVFGIHSQRRKTTFGNRYARGPKVPYWLDDIVASASALGVNL